MFAQLTFDAVLARAKGDAGMRLAEGNLIEWRDVVRGYVLDLAAGQRLTSDDLVARFGLPTDVDGRPTNNGVGGLINGLARSGKIKQVGWAKSARVTNHSSDLRVWERCHDQA